jgi:hypothetical protein
MTTFLSSSSWCDIFVLGALTNTSKRPRKVFIKFQEILMCGQLIMTIFELIASTWKIQSISYFTSLRRTRSMIRRLYKQFLKLYSKRMKPHTVSFSGNILLSHFEASQIRDFQCFWKIRRRIISET